jgi:thioesterase domain-containing protein
MTDISALSDTKRALLEMLLRGEKSLAGGSMETPKSPSPLDERTPMVAVNSNGTRCPFFYLHGDWTGGGFHCFTLANDLGSDQPFYICHPYQFTGLNVLPTLEEMSAAHIKAIRTVQPRGPYQIGGFCNGGLLCYEMARQLRATGERVTALILVDSIPPRLTHVRGAIDHIGHLLHAGNARQLQWFLHLQHCYRFLFERNAEDFEDLELLDPRSHRIFPPLEALRLEYPALFIWATAAYEPSFYPEKVTLFWEEAEPERRSWWERFAEGRDGQVETVIVPGTHKTCKTDHIHDLAAHLNEKLEEASVL